jgi:hypothetical protein
MEEKIVIEETKMDAYIKQITSVVDSIEIFCTGLDKAINLMIFLAQSLSEKDQLKVKEAIGLILDHIEAGSLEARYALHPVASSQEDYSR